MRTIYLKKCFSFANYRFQPLQQKSKLWIYATFKIFFKFCGCSVQLITLYHYEYESGYKIYFLMHSLPFKNLFRGFLFVCFAYLIEVSPTYTLISLFTISSGLSMALQAWGGGSYLHSLLLFFPFREQNMVFQLRLYWSMHKPYNQTQNQFLVRLHPALLVLLTCRVSRCLH